MNESQRRHIVTVGGGFGGIAAAREQRKADAKVTLIDKTNHHLFQPLFYQVVTAAQSPGDIATPIRAIVGKYSNICILLGEMESVNPDKKSLSLADGRTIDYEQLILASGSKYNYFNKDSWEQHAPGLKFSGIITWFLWSIVHILFLIGFRNRFRAFAEWIWYYFTFKRGVRLITDRSLRRHCKSNTE